MSTKENRNPNRLAVPSLRLGGAKKKDDRTNKANNIALTPPIKRKRHEDVAPGQTLRAHLGRKCREKGKDGHTCGPNCITPLPTRLCSMTSRRKKQKKISFEMAEETKKTETESNDTKKRSRNEMEVDLFKRLSRHSLLGEKELLSMLNASEAKVEPVPLRSKTLAGIAHHIARNRCKNIIIMSGAGISCSAGIPDFRSPKTGLYDNLQKYDLPTPTAMFDITYFVKRPEPFFTLAKELYPGNFKPTPVHYFIRLLHEKGLLLRNYTQNIDGLERIAGVPAEAIVEAHGSFYSSHCIACKKEHDTEEIKEKIFSCVIPRCNDCDSLVKPDITFFGEPLPQRFFSMAEQDFGQCDLLIVLGTSLKVRPFNELIKKVPTGTPRFLINREQAGLDICGKKDERCFRFDECDNETDVHHMGDCDSAVNLLIDLLDWRDEFEGLMTL